MADKKMDARTRAAVVGCAVAGVAVGGSVAGSLISSAIGHPIGPRWGGLYNPLDGFRGLWTVDNLCVLQAHAADLRASLIPGAHVAAGPTCRLKTEVIASVNVRTGLWMVFGALPLVGSRVQVWLASKAPVGRVLPKRKVAPGNPVIEVGTASIGTLSSNALASRNLPRAIRPGQVVRLTRDELKLHLIIVGSTGSGKTDSLFVPILRDCLEQLFGALISNAKGNFDLTVMSIAQKAGREDDVRVIGIDAEEVNLFDAIAPDMVSTHISALLRITDKSEKAGMWNAQASNHAQAVLGVLWYLRKYDGPDEYTICGLNRYMSTPGFANPERDDEGKLILTGQSVHERMNDVIRSIQLKLKGIPKSDESRAALRAELEDDLSNITSHYQKIRTLARDETAQRSVEFTLQQLLNAVCTPKIEKAFFNTNLPKSARPYDMDTTYTEGAIFCVNVPDEIIGEPASRALTVLNKRVFFNAMGRRRYYGNNVNQSRLVVYAVDEAQDSITEGDQTALAKLRDTGCVCLWATQSFTALEDRVGPVLAKTVWSNLRQKFYLRGEDDMTNEMAVKLLGDVEIEKTASSSTQQPGKWSPSKGTNTSTHKERAATAELILNLEGDEALYTGTIDRLAAVGILRTRFMRTH